MSVPAEGGGEALTISGLRSLASRLLATLQKGAVVWLEGELGAGKTTFVQLLVEEAGGEDASSPSFALVNEYSTAQGDIYHADCYRLRSPGEALDLDLWRLAEQARMLLVEWPLKGGDNVPSPTAVVHLEHTDDPKLRVVRVEEC